MIHTTNRSLPLRAAISMLLAPVTLMAQEAVGPGTTLEEITVTASKRSESMQDVAVSMTAVSQEQLDGMGVNNFEDFARTQASLGYTSVGANKLKLIVRGLSEGPPENTDYQIQSTVGIYIDETPVTSAVATPDLHILDMERIELLRGPQGTLYGAGSMGGTLKLVTNKPNLADFTARVEATYAAIDGGDNDFEVSGVANAPLGDKNALRLVAYTKEDGGFIDNTATGEENWNTIETTGGRASWLLQPTDDWSILATYMHQRVEVGGRNRMEPELGDLKFYGPGPDSQEDTVDLLGLTINYSGLGFADVVSATSYYEGHNDFFFDWSDVGYVAAEPLFFFTGTEPIVWQHIDQTYEVISEEIRFVSKGDGALRWTAGVFIDSEKTGYEQTVWADDLATLMSITPLGAASVQPGGVAYVGDDIIYYSDSNDHKVEQVALFGEFTYAFSDKWSATIGARYFRVDTETSGRSVGAQNIITGGAAAAAEARLIEQGLSPTPAQILAEVFSTTGLVDSSATGSDDGVNPKVGLEFRPNDDLLTYATASKGYRTGGVNGGMAVSFGAPQTFGPDSLWNYELGFKSTVLDGRMTLNASVYYLDWSDIISVGGVNGFRYRVNGGKASVKGSELDIALQATSHWYFRAGVAYNDSQLDENICSNLISDAPCTPESTDLVGLKGDQLVGSADLSYTAGVQYENQLTGTLAWRAALDFQHVGKSFDRYESMPDVQEQGDYDQTNLRFTLMSDSGWELALFGKNLTDERGVTNATYVQGNLNPSQDWLRWSIIRPRTYGITARYSF